MLGFFPVSSTGNRYIVVLQDKFTKWTEAYAVPNFTASVVAQKIVYEFCSRFGTPFEIHSDQGRNYGSKLFQEVCTLLEIHKSRTTPWHPRANGGCKKFNRVLADMIAAFVDRKQKEWDVHLPLLTAAYRSSKHEQTGWSPNMLMLPREVRVPIELTLGGLARHEGPQSYCDFVQDLKDRLCRVHELAREHTRVATERQKRDHDTRISQRKYKVGDLVDYVNKTKQVGRSPKLEPNRWIGPCVVTKAHSDLLYAIKQGPRTKVKLLHHDNLKLHQGTPIPEWARLLQEQLQASSTQEDSTMKARDGPQVTQKDEACLLYTSDAADE